MIRKQLSVRGMPLIRIRSTQLTYHSTFIELLAWSYKPMGTASLKVKPSSSSPSRREQTFVLLLLRPDRFLLALGSGARVRSPLSAELRSQKVQLGEHHFLYNSVPIMAAGLRGHLAGRMELNRK